MGPARLLGPGKVLGELRGVRVEADAYQAAAGLLCSGEPFGEGHGHGYIIATARPGWRARALLGSMLGGYRENRIAQQAPHWTAIGTAAGESPCGQAHQHHSPESIFYLPRPLRPVSL